MARSRYDELHDKYDKIASTKAGTRYERLAALVFKILRQDGTVVHDLRLVGNSEVKHQIDVTVERAGEPRRVLVECKDFDVSGDKVGLSILRDFWAVADDTKPDEAIVVSCNGFTEDACKFAKAKGIKLAVLRKFEEGDWTGRVREIVIRMGLYDTTDPVVTLVIPNEDAQNKFVADLTAAGIVLGVRRGQPVFLNTPNGRVPFNEFIEQEIRKLWRWEFGPIAVPLELPDTTVEVEERGPVPIRGLRLSFEIVVSEEESRVLPKRVAELILKGLGDADLVVFDDDLTRYRIDAATGEVLPRY